MSPILRTALIPAAALLLGACSSGGLLTEAGDYFKRAFSTDSWRFYRMDISQGNLLDEKAVARIRPGLTREQVVYLLGNPVLPSMFHDDRWDYIYYLDSLEKENEHYHLTLFFDEDRIVRVRKPKTPPPQNPA